MKDRQINRASRILRQRFTTVDSDLAWLGSASERKEERNWMYCIHKLMIHICEMRPVASFNDQEVVITAIADTTTNNNSIADTIIEGRKSKVESRKSKVESL